VKGVRVTNVERNSPAYQSNLRTGDIIVSVNRKDVTNVDEFTAAMKDSQRQTALFIKRGAEDLLVIVQ
jgi:S1-C subfamily serine protease